MTEQNQEQIPIDNDGVEDEPNQDTDAGVGDAEIEYDEDPFAEEGA